MSRPNLLFFMSDNHNRNVSGCYGHPLVKTPTIDEIAAAGVRFDRAYSASPLCCPARAALATGRFPHQTGYWDNIFAYDGRVKSWMHRLRDAGYEVISIGKLHFRSPKDDNGFSKEIVPMHIMDGKGGIRALLRGYGAAQPNTTGELWDLYFKQSGVGRTHYEEYDEDITRHAISWLTENATSRHRPWALFVSYVSPHPPFTVPQRLYDLYPLDSVPLPPAFLPHERAMHPAAQYHREIFGTREMDEQAVRHMAASYFALITHLDEQIGQVLHLAESLDVMNETNVIYTSDHGEMYGSHGLLGKSILYEGAVGVPLIMSGPTIRKGGTVKQLVSHVDIYPTILELCEVPSDDTERDQLGKSLCSALKGVEQLRTCFAEYHANYSRNGSFMLQDADKKLIYHVGMPPELFDLEKDPTETHNLAALPSSRHAMEGLEIKLRSICDPEEVDRRAKEDQRRAGDAHGGVEKLGQAPNIKFTPPPGVSPDVAWNSNQ